MQRESWGLYIIPIKAPSEKCDPKFEFLCRLETVWYCRHLGHLRHHRLLWTYKLSYHTYISGKALLVTNTCAFLYISKAYFRKQPHNNRNKQYSILKSQMCSDTWHLQCDTQTWGCVKIVSGVNTRIIDIDLKYITYYEGLLSQHLQQKGLPHCLKGSHQHLYWWVL